MLLFQPGPRPGSVLSSFIRGPGPAGACYAFYSRAGPGRGVLCFLFRLGPPHPAQRDLIFGRAMKFRPVWGRLAPRPQNPLKPLLGNGNLIFGFMSSVRPFFWEAEVVQNNPYFLIKATVLLPS